jgi:acyl-CoA ligase (AMP-forming) (exosortase A-associated)
LVPDHFVRATLGGHADRALEARDAGTPMLQNLADLITLSAEKRGEAMALGDAGRNLTYGAFAADVAACAGGLLELHLERGDRVAVYLEKTLETVTALFAAAAGGLVMVPVNPLLKAPQVRHILRDCGVRVLVTSPMRLAGLAAFIGDCPDLKAIVLTPGDAQVPDLGTTPDIRRLGWQELMMSGASCRRPRHRIIDNDLVAVLYTSGSTGLPKGVMLSHRNMLAGALSVSSYLGNVADDRILAVLPLSFDAGFSQLTTAFAVGATAVLMNYLLPRDVVRICDEQRITGLTAVPPLWIQLAQVAWPETASTALRYFANTGGRMPLATLDRLRSLFPTAKPYLMYGLTEAFRSTFLDPTEIDRRPDSIGKAVPGAELFVVRPDGSRCAVGEPGELVHRGAFVALGYWSDAERTAQRFRPMPDHRPGGGLTEIAVWSGDTVRMDEEGFLYFVGRRDEMIKTSGYRVSPTELEEVIYSTRLVGEVAAVGVPHSVLGQAIVVVATPPDGSALDVEALLERCRTELPAFMVPHRIVSEPALPRNPNGKIDRARIAADFADLFQEQAS